MPNSAESYPLHGFRGSSVILGFTLALAGFAVLISARLIPFAFLVVVIALLVVALSRGSLGELFSRPGIGVAAIAAFILFALISAAWAVEPSRTLTRVGLAAVYVVASVAVLRIVRLQPVEEAQAMARGLWIGFLAGVSLFLIELASNQAIRIWLYNTIHIRPEILRPIRYYTWTDDKLVAIHNLSLSRTITPVTILLWPALLAVFATVVRPWRNTIIILLTTVSVAVAMLALNTTSKIAIVAALVTYGVACYARRFVAYALAFVWIFCCLASLPAALLLHRNDLHNAEWLKPSAQLRIIFWKNTADLTLKAPVLGVGADMSYVLAPTLEKSLPPGKFDQAISRHAHSAFLQTWFELGFVGALLLMAAGLGLLWEIRRIETAAQPFAYALFASAGPYLAASYGMWQTWYAALFGLAIVLFFAGLRAMPKPAPAAR